MVTVEVLEKKLEKLNKKLEKLNKKLERINAAKATDWEKNPYCYQESDLNYTTRDIQEAEEILASLKADLVTAKEKAASRNVKVIIDFLEDWKTKVNNYYHELLPQYLKAKERLNKELEGLDIAYSNEDYRTYRKLKHEFQTTWNFYEKWLTKKYSHETKQYYYVIDEEKLTKHLKREAEAKYDDIINRTNKIVGTITDATHLHIGVKGDLEGYIIGDYGKAHVQTIGAGGYNVQCFHFRTLVKECKD
jgi:hypothetical protein